MGKGLCFFVYQKEEYRNDLDDAIDSSDDIRWLAEVWKRESIFSKTRKRIERRISVITENFEMSELVLYLETSSLRSKPKKILENRILEIIRDTTDSDQLTSWYDSMPLRRKPKKLLKSRIKKLSRKSP